MAKKRAVILSSGGLNSAVTTAIAAAEYEPALMHVRFGHRAEQREAELFEKQAEYFRVATRLITDMPHFAAIGASARIAHDKPLEDALSAGENESTYYIPGLIGSLTSAAFNWASAINASAIFLGVCECLGPPGPRTAGVYPDYSRDYAQLLQHALNVAYPFRRITLEVPLIDLSRRDIIRLGQRLHVPFELTWSCNSSGRAPCGGCLGCATRSRGFLDAGIADPLHNTLAVVA